MIWLVIKGTIKNGSAIKLRINVTSVEATAGILPSHRIVGVYIAVAIGNPSK